MVALFLFAFGITGWLLVAHEVVALRRLRATPGDLAYRRPAGVGLLWLIQAMHLLFWAYRQTWWLWLNSTYLFVRSSSTLAFPKFARFTAVPYRAYPLSCCLLE